MQDDKYDVDKYLKNKNENNNINNNEQNTNNKNNPILDTNIDISSKTKDYTIKHINKDENKSKFLKINKDLYTNKNESDDEDTNNFIYNAKENLSSLGTSFWFWIIVSIIAIGFIPIYHYLTPETNNDFNTKNRICNNLGFENFIQKSRYTCGNTSETYYIGNCNDSNTNIKIVCENNFSIIPNKNACKLCDENTNCLNWIIDNFGRGDCV